MRECGTQCLRQNDAQFYASHFNVELMVGQVSEGSQDAAGPVFLVPSVRDVYENNPGKLQLIGEPGETPDGLWLSAQDDSGNGIYFTDESKHES